MKKLTENNEKMNQEHINIYDFFGFLNQNVTNNMLCLCVKRNKTYNKKNLLNFTFSLKINK
jgi:hypothetical protein